MSAQRKPRQRDPTTIGPPNVLIVAEDGEAGGIGRYCVDVAAALGARARVVCLCPSACDVASCWLANLCSIREVQLVRVSMPARGWRRGFAGLVRLWRSSGRPTIHVNGRRGNFVSLAARLLVPGYRFVTTAHGLLGLHARRNRLYRLIDLAASRAASAVIAVSADTRRQLVAAGNPADRTVVILNGLGEPERIALRSVAEQRWRGDRRSIHVGYLGRLSREKGTHELLEIARGLLGENLSASFEIAGTGPDQAWLENASRDLTETGRLTFRGAVQDVVGFLAGVDVLVMPSHNEGLPYVLLEAMSAGCAIVAFRVGGVPEVVSDASLGVLVEPGDVDAFVRAVVQLAANPLRVTAMGQAAASHVSTNFALMDRLPLLALTYSRQATTRSEAGTPPADRTG